MSNDLFLVWEDNGEEYDCREVMLRAIFGPNELEEAREFAKGICVAKLDGDGGCTGNEVSVQAWDLSTQKSGDCLYRLSKAEEVERLRDELYIELKPFLEKKLNDVQHNFENMLLSKLGLKLKELAYSPDEITALTQRKLKPI